MMKTMFPYDKASLRRWLIPILVCIFASTLAAETDQDGNVFDQVTKLRDTADVTVWRVGQPNVKHSSTNYTQIWLLPGDIINVAAGGCVQTGGKGLTWKRYVDPSGPDSDRYYHGLIQIKGINAKLTRFRDFGMDKNYPVQTEGFVVLGYEDDGYSDNGYYAHDDGDNDQCRHVGPAWVIVSVGHHGVAPPPASQFAFTGITPDNFRYEAAWPFPNFNTPELSWDSFKNAFNLDEKFWNYLDPSIYIVFGAARGIAAGGNCSGMCLLAEIGEDQFVVGNLKEDFWNNYKAAPPVTSQINTAHWKQLSVFFLHNWLGTVFNSPSDTAKAIEHDLTKKDYNYGLLSLEHGGSGHVLVPLRVSHQGQQTTIDVYDPNRPSPSSPDSGSYPQVIINGGNWSYQMAGGDTWKGPDGQVGSGFGYIPYVGSNGWSDLGASLSNIIDVLFGNDVTIEQVTDSTGKHLYLPNRPGMIDNSAQGFGRSLVRLPLFAQSDVSQKRPRSSGPPMVLARNQNLSGEVMRRVQQMEHEYADYTGSGQIYLATATALKDLTFTLSSKNPTRPVRALVGQAGQFYEIKSAPQTPALTSPSLVIHSLSNFGAGMSIQDRKGTPLKVTFTHGLASNATHAITIQKTDEISVSAAPVKVQLAANSELEVVSAGPAAPTKVNTQVIEANGNARTLPTRELKIRPSN